MLGRLALACWPRALRRCQRPANVVQALRPSLGYTERTANLWNRVRPELLGQCRRENLFLLVRCKAPKTPDGSIFLLTNHLSDQHALQTDVYFFPTWLEIADSKKRKNQDSFEALSHPSVSRRANLSQAARSYLVDLGFKCPDGEPEEALLIWLHAASTGYSTEYIAENAGALRQDWPRIPLPATADALLASAELGHTVAALLNVEEPVGAVTTGSVRFELRPIGSIAKAAAARIDPGAGDLAVTAGWGHAGQGGVTMPGKGRLVERAYSDEELAAFREGLGELHLTYDQLMACLSAPASMSISTTTPTGAACPGASGATRSAATR